MCCMLIYARPIIAIRELFSVDNYPFLKSFFSDIQKIDTFQSNLEIILPRVTIYVIMINTWE